MCAGSYKCRAGWASQESPCLLFKNIIARSKAKKTAVSCYVCVSICAHHSLVSWRHVTIAQQCIVRFICAVYGLTGYSEMLCASLLSFEFLLFNVFGVRELAQHTHIEMPFGMLTCVGPRSHVLDGAADVPGEGAVLDG